MYTPDLPPVCYTSRYNARVSEVSIDLSDVECTEKRSNAVSRIEMLDVSDYRSSERGRPRFRKLPLPILRQCDLPKKRGKRRGASANNDR